ncbi:hypothetical protein L195_g011388 [Trifolium pratense]|uniref:Uncharacterized protein n=1 Tax=Trifolium pratense TaxID=57577 RepID=A0A2K3PHG6_TRIPR|nr:hypothetical protein L195_g011388 [Trifolium pratense]
MYGDENHASKQLVCSIFAWQHSSLIFATLVTLGCTMLTTSEEFSTKVETLRSKVSKLEAEKLDIELVVEGKGEKLKVATKLRS